MDSQYAIVPVGSVQTEPGTIDLLGHDRAQPHEAARRDQASTPVAMSAQLSIVVDRPLTEVFAFGSDLVQRCRWQRGTRTEGLVEPEVTGLGARCIETRKASGGATEEWNLEVVAFEPVGLLTIRAENDGARIVERHTFARDASSVGRTRYTLMLEASGARWTTGDLQRQLVDHLIHLRDCLENPDSATGAALWRAPRTRAKAGCSDTPTAQEQAGTGGPAIEA